jgi:hypothetical protein
MEEIIKYLKVIENDYTLLHTVLLADKCYLDAKKIVEETQDKP